MRGDERVQGWDAQLCDFGAACSAGTSVAAVREELRSRSCPYLGHALVENRDGLIAAAMVTRADGYAEREAALRMLAMHHRGHGRGLRREGLRD